MAEPQPDIGRQVDIPPPAQFPLDSDKLWDGDQPRIDVLKEHLKAEGLLHERDLKKLLGLASDIFRSEPNLLELLAPITICGDVHGQLYDLCKLIDTVGGTPGETKYLFLGDYVDRGNFSVEVVLLLWAYKIVFPDMFFLIRGNHECRHLTEYFTFKEECIKKYSEDVYDMMMESFDALPLSALMNEQFLCVHGGISPSIRTLEDIRTIDRFQETPQAGAMCDLMWADPIEDYDEDKETTFIFNEARGCSYAYGYRAVLEFLEKNNLLSLIRAHEAQDAGYKMHLRSAKTGFPTVITLFSAPNYLDAYGNKAAVMRYENNVMNIRQFHHTDHPYWLPGFMDVFTWSIPFVSEKVAEILYAILKMCDDDEETESEEQEAELAAARRLQLKTKVRSVSKLLRMYNALRQEREATMQLGALAGQPRDVSAALLKDKESGNLANVIGDFKKAKTLDKQFEKRPPSQPSITRRSSKDDASRTSNE
eukprot:TRINITY_DN307_c1_g1_i2.p1 TRINITY_DN307_c1_g1~~TRINITY_DN307_c1_g1_i2.p1  ORF type:complete len:493 (+),score=199.27 TRINITY_DN307_c1_g1_i2:41-1480(+)